MCSLMYHLFVRPKASSALFFKYNTQLGPPYHVLIDTNFINFSIKNKLDIIQSMMDCLYAKCECVARLVTGGMGGTVGITISE